MPLTVVVLAPTTPSTVPSGVVLFLLPPDQVLTFTPPYRLYTYFLMFETGFLASQAGLRLAMSLRWP